MTTPPPIAIERAHGLRPEDFAGEYVARRRPVILTGIADRWAAVSQWSAEYFAREYGDVPVEVEVQGDRDPCNYFAQRHYIRTDIAGFVERLPSEHPRYYLSQWNATAALPELRQSFSSLAEFQPCRPRALGPWLRLTPHLWFGAAGTFSTLHYDLADNLFVQVWGRKRIRLYSPDQGQYMHRSHALCHHHKLCLTLFSPVDPERPDLQRHPHFAEARGYVCDLQPGEVLYIPVGWWHHLVALEPSICISHWWYRAPMQRRRAADLCVGAACSLRLAARRFGRRILPATGSTT